jgi:CDGSH-type Zn-finger protein
LKRRFYKEDAEFFFESTIQSREVHLAGTKITVKHNGSLRVEGDFTLVDMDGKEFGLGGRTAISLCRCGHSKNKPFCDSTHKEINFQSEVKARELPPPVPKPPST